MYKKTILIDLDGVLNEYTGNYNPNEIPEMKMGADKFLEKLFDKFELIIFTTRDLAMTKNWLKSNKLDKYVADITNTKVPAWLIIDDRCITFNGDYNEISRQITTFKPWYK